MRINTTSESGVFNPRLFLTFVLCAIGVSLAMFSWASNPATSTITVPSSVNQTVSVTWSGEIPAGANPSSDCSALGGTPVADQHIPTINVPANIYSSLNAKFTFSISWDGASGNDEILSVVLPDGTTLDSSDTSNSTETVEGTNLPAGAYKVIACGFTSTSAQSYVGKLTISTTTGGPPPPPPTPAPTPSFAGGPRYYNYAPPPAVGEAAGEPSIGYNLVTKRALYIAGLQTLRVTFPENITPAGSVPAACDAQWEDVSYVVTKTKSLDPILFTDQKTGRTFVSQLNSVVPPASPVLIGLNSLMAYTDDDGATWTPAQVNPPDGSYDHQTVGAGPYPAAVPLGNPVNKGSAVYYCSQAGVTAFCSRSDDGGLNFGKSTAPYNLATDGCAGIHGHVKVAPDGTVYLPNRGCNNVQSVAVSNDAGTTWTVRPVKNANFTAGAPPGILDPSVAIATDGTLYFSYINTDGHAHVAVSKDKGATWLNDADIGASQNIGNAVFVEAVAGDPNRAAVGFIGTTQTGDHQATDFNGTWYAFLAHTYDGGAHWTTVNATPNHPVQKEACIWNQGGANQCRNLLDFNEITMDEKGRVLYAYADGCIDDCEEGGPNSYSSKATIARQSGGRGLLAQFDPAEPVAPQAACLSGRRDDLASYLTWIAPDNGGSDVTAYKIYRGTNANNMVAIGQQVGDKTTYNDRTANPAVATYVYKIQGVNAVGNGVFSNIVTLPLGKRLEKTGACSQPGQTVLTDPVGDESDGLTQHDITSVSIAEPVSNATTGAADNIIFTMKVVDLATVPPSWRWSVRFTVPGYNPPAAAVVGAQEDWFVSMISDNAGPRFTYGTTGVFQGAARFFTTIGNLDAKSNYNADGTITMVLPKALFQSKAVCTGGCPALAPNTPVNIALGSVRFSPPSEVPGSGGTNETIPDSTGGASYALRATNLCLPNTAPVAMLTADKSGGVAPVTVTLNGGASFDGDSIDSIATYTFNFNDGSDDVVQNSPVLVHTFSQGGLYDVKLVVTDSRGKVSSNTAHALIEVQTTGAPSAAQLLNISSRLRVETGDNTLIGGFIITGTDPKKVVVRALGPSTQVPGFLGDPMLELRDSTGALLVNNDDWSSSQNAAEIQANNLAPANGSESAILTQLVPGAYTAVVRGKGTGVGTAVVEAYDLDPNNNSKLANLSTRGYVQTGDNVLIAGFITGNRNSNINVLVRAIGPSLAGIVPTALSDPTLQLFNSNGTSIAFNDNWQDSQKTLIEQSGIPPTNLNESAIVAGLVPGAYTAIVRGANTGVGNAVVEVYNLP
ncbi:MAG TPA: PKD domain-containing protein [Chthoniobacterales bacterium]|nr:PKD domain-containing protein [Chthoniobacterales bacterium]